MLRFVSPLMFIPRFIEAIYFASRHFICFLPLYALFRASFTLSMPICAACERVFHIYFITISFIVNAAIDALHFRCCFMHELEARLLLQTLFFTISYSRCLRDGFIYSLLSFRRLSLFADIYAFDFAAAALPYADATPLHYRCHAA